MIRLLGVVHDLVDVVRIGAPEEDDIRPPLAQVRRDLDDLVLRLGIRLCPFPLPADFLVKEPLVAILLTVQGPALEPVGFLNAFRDHLLHMLMPKPAVDVDLVPCPFCTGKGREIPATVRRIDMRDAILQQQRIICEDRRGLEESILGGDMLQLIQAR